MASSDDEDLLDCNDEEESATENESMTITVHFMLGAINTYSVYRNAKVVDLMQMITIKTGFFIHHISLNFDEEMLELFSLFED
jgi:hypothetical protein